MSGRTDELEIPEDKPYFKIGEVARMLGLESYVLRYWETEFEQLRPEKTKSGQRIYQRADIDLLRTIRGLLYTEMFTIAGARRQLTLHERGEGVLAQASAPAVDPEELAALRQESASLRQEHEIAQAALEALRGEHATVRRRLDEVESKRLASRREIEALEAARDELQASLEEALTQMGEFSAQAEMVLALEAERDMLRDHLSQVEADLEALVAERHKRGSHIEATVQQMSAPFQAEIARLKGELAELREINVGLRGEVAAQQAGRHNHALLDALRRELESLSALADVQ